MKSTNWRRWLPSNPALISGALTSAVMIAATRLGLHIVPGQLQEALTPLVSFVVASIVHRTAPSPTPAPVPQADPPAPSSALASILAQAIEARLATDPALEAQLVSTALSLAANPQPAPHLPQT